MGKIAVVTGASRGIGKAIAVKLGQMGMTVIVNYNGSKERAEAVKEEIIQAGGNAETYMCNVSDYSACEVFIKEVVEKYGAIDVLVNNAGITRDGLVLRMSEEDFDAVIATNLKGAFNTVKFASKFMLKKKSGKIINMASVVGLTGNAGQLNYAASKAGIIGLTKSAAKEFAGKNITVNAIAPGFICTEMTDVLSDAVKEKTIAQIPMKKFGQVEDIANAVGFLASDEAGYITGQVLNVDGGMVM